MLNRKLSSISDSTQVILFGAINCLRIVKLEVPENAKQDENVDLNCVYYLKGDYLHSIKWFFNSTEFYRYLPEELPPQQELMLIFQSQIEEKFGCKIYQKTTLEMVLIAVANCLKIVKLEVPANVTEGSDVDLICKYDLQGDQLYSVKWYFNLKEFYRYYPRDSPSQQVFTIPGIVVDLSKSNNEKVRLLNVAKSSSGVYRCEVSTEAPSFATAMQQGNMNVSQAVANNLKIVKFEVPRTVGEGSDVTLICKYELQGDKLYSVKWYFNSIEFYRYNPNDLPSQLVFTIPGIVVDLSKSNNEKVRLLNVSKASSGVYRCE
ncbi:hypothetical protein B4U80_10829, partial [Leptotrombidium deliense]